jgi:hypothetical protein
MAAKLSAAKPDSAQVDLFGLPVRAGVFGTPWTQRDLVAVCRALLGDGAVVSPAERTLIDSSPTRPDVRVVEFVRRSILAGEDPLGETFSRIRSGPERRALGAVYTPLPVVRSMVDWVAARGTPSRVVDPGAGSGRFILAAGAAFPAAELMAVEADALAALMLRANVEVLGYTSRTRVHVMDYRDVALDKCAGTTAFIGNPPYVRHHDIGGPWKAWYTERFAALGIRASALAGLHLHFFLQTRLLARRGDLGAFITSAEWLDVNYGSALRRLLLDELGGVALHVLEPEVAAFPGTATTAAITCFHVGETQAPLRVRAVSELAELNGLSAGRPVERERFQQERRWSIIVRPTEPSSEGEIELGCLFRVHRGQVTGANGVWIAGDRADVLPERFKTAAVTKARELIQAGPTLQSDETLRRVIDIPAEIDQLGDDDRRRVMDYLAWARSMGADQGYVARHRKAWWSVGLKVPAPILCTYMARRAPQFTLNACAAGHINVAHGLYPREPIDDELLTRLVAWLNHNIRTSSGRTYAGGLTKFEPKEIERLRIPRLESLAA